MNKHFQKKHKTRQIDPDTICQLCQEVFPDKISNLSHPCPVQLKAKLALKDVIGDESTKQNQRLSCPKCDETFDLTEKLKNHYSEHHVNYLPPKREIKEEKTGETGTALCDQCPFIGSAEDLNWHVKQVHKDR